MAYGDVSGQIIRFSGVSGTVTVPEGAQVWSIQAHAASSAVQGTVQIFTDASVITIPGSASTYFYYDCKHKGVVAQTTTNSSQANKIVFTNTTMFLVECHLPYGR